MTGRDRLVAYSIKRVICHTDRWLLLAVIGTSLSLSAARHLVRWDRVTTHPFGAPISAVVLVTASGAAVAGWAGVAAAGATTTTLLLAAVSASYVLVAPCVARASTTRLALEASGTLVALITLAVIADVDDAWLLQGVLSTCLVVAAARHLVEQQRQPHDPERSPFDVAAVAAVGVLASASWAVASWSALLDVAPLVHALALCAVAVVALLSANDVARRPAVRIATEVGAVLVGAAGYAATGSAAQASVVLAVLGTALAVLVLRHRDRHLAGFGAAGLLALAELVRASESLPGAPELVALPGAAVLLLAGYRRLGSDAEVGTWPMLGAGLMLALAPSLLMVLGDPVQPRTLLLGAAALAALAVGGVRHWQAPYLCGAAVLVVIGLRFLGPVAASAFDTAIGPWATFGVVGVALLGAGILWERTLARLRGASGWVLALR